jgi:putative hydrolase of the HAD superfamily
MWLFVDFDGTLVDSLNVARLVYERFVISCGGKPDDGEFRALNGPSLSEIVDIIATRLELAADRSQLLERYDAIWATSYDAVQPKSGAADLLREAQTRGLQTAIVTSASARFIERYATRLGWNALIDQTISGDEVKRSKPDPAIYRAALSRTGAVASAVKALEDSINGVRAAVAAGISVVGLADDGPHGFGRDELLSAGASRVIDSLADFFGGDNR